MKLKAINEPSININGTSLKGYVITTREELTRAFGEPRQYTGDEEKVRFEWRLQFETDSSDIVATVYDWKNYNYILFRDEVYQWHIGGNNPDAVQAVTNALISRGGRIWQTETSNI